MNKEEKHTKKIYNTMAKFYHDIRTRKDAEGWFFNENLEMPAMLNLLGNVRGKKILDWGCGSGIYAKILTKKGAIVKGFDISEEMINIARMENPELDLRIGSGLNIPFNEKFDIVFSSLALHYIRNWNLVFKEVRRILKREGLFLFSDSNPVVDSAKSIEFEGKKLKVLGIKNYFEEIPKSAVWNLPNGKSVKIIVYTKTYQTVIKRIISNGFEIIDYMDAQPLKKVKKQFPEEYGLWSKVPKFCVWKLRKK